MNTKEFLDAYDALTTIQKLAIEMKHGFRIEKTVRSGDRTCYAVWHKSELVYVADTFKEYVGRLYHNKYISEKDLLIND